MQVELVRSPDLSKAEVDRRLYQVYSLILSLLDENETTSGCEFADPSPLVADDAPTTEAETTKMSIP